MRKNSIMLADGNRLFIDALKAIIERDTDFTVLSCDKSGVETVRRAMSVCPDILVIGQILTDITMLSVVNELKRCRKNIGYLFIVNDSSSELLKALGNLASAAVIEYSSDIKEFLAALSSLSRGERYISSNVLENLRSLKKDIKTEDILCELTHREREILYWLSLGNSNKEISSMMILSEKTVKNHVSHILRKLGVSDRTKAAACAWKSGLSLIPEEFFSPEIEGM